MANTANYNQLLPTVGASASSWGSENNALHVKWDAELWKALYLDGSRAMSGPLAAAVGSAAAPGLSFAGDANSGLYWAGADSIALSLGGTARATFSTTGAVFTGSIGCGAISAGAVGCTTLAPSGLTSIAASATGGAKLNLAPGTAPSAPNNGDLWTTSSGVFARLGGATVDLTSTAGPWATPRDLSLTGDVTATLSNVDGSANKSAAASLAANAVTSGKIADGAVTLAKLAQASGSARFVGRRAGAGAGVMQEMTAGEALAALGLTNAEAAAWVECAISGGPSFTQTGLNLSLSADAGTGNYIASFGAPLASAAYAVVISGTRTSTGGDVAVCSYHSRTTGGFKVRVETLGGAGLAPTGLSIVVFGPFV